MLMRRAWPSNDVFSGISELMKCALLYVISSNSRLKGYEGSLDMKVQLNCNM